MGEAYIIRKNGNIIGVQLCEQVDNVAVSPAYLANVLTWSKPLKDQNNSYAGVRIVAKKNSCPSGINDGEVVYEGNDLEFTHSNLIEGDTWYYRFFTYTSDKFYQTSMRYVYQQVLAGYVWKKYTTKEVTEMQLTNVYSSTMEIASVTAEMGKDAGGSYTGITNCEYKENTYAFYADRLNQLTESGSHGYYTFPSSKSPIYSVGQHLCSYGLKNTAYPNVSFDTLSEAVSYLLTQFGNAYNFLRGKYANTANNSSSNFGNVYYITGNVKRNTADESDDELLFGMDGNLGTPQSVTSTVADQYIGSVMDLDSNAYPSNGIHTDGYWYVLQAS